VDVLWAPWRMEFIKNDRPSGCIFCEFPKSSADRENLILGRSAHSFAMFNKFPYNSGHVMVIPRRHGADLGALPDGELLDLQKLLQLSVEVIREAYAPDGFNIGMNLGRVAGAGIPDHLHHHVVPRWGGDTNFMPVVGQTKVLPQLLADTREMLAEAWPDPT